MVTMWDRTGEMDFGHTYLVTMRDRSVIHVKDVVGDDTNGSLRLCPEPPNKPSWLVPAGDVLDIAVAGMCPECGQMVGMTDGRLRTHDINGMQRAVCLGSGTG